MTPVEKLVSELARGDVLLSDEGVRITLASEPRPVADEGLARTFDVELVLPSGVEGGGEATFEEIGTDGEPGRIEVVGSDLTRLDAGLSQTQVRILSQCAYAIREQEDAYVRVYLEDLAVRILTRDDATDAYLEREGQNDLEISDVVWDPVRSVLELKEAIASQLEGLAAQPRPMISDEEADAILRQVGGIETG